MSSAHVVERIAVEGGSPVRQGPFPPWPHFDAEMIEAVGAVLHSGKVNAWTGNEVQSFEREFASFIGVPHAVAVANGTVALELALASLGIGPGDEVVVPSRTFIATASSVVMRGARPVIADVDRYSQNLTVETVQDVLTPRTKAIIAVHLSGWPCDMDPIMQLAGAHGLKVIEDCAQAHGATYKGHAVGSLGHAAAFSFCQDKIITTGGEGGMLTTNDPAVWERAWSLKDHGKSWQAVHSHDPDLVFKWLHTGFGTNWRMTEMQAAIGRIMLRRLPDWITRRRRNALLLQRGLGELQSLRVVIPPAEIGHAYYKFYAFLQPELIGQSWTRDRIVRALQSEGIPCGSGICPEIHREEAFVSAGWQPSERLPIAAELGETSLMFLVHPTLSDSDMRATCRAVTKVLQRASNHPAATSEAA